MQRHSSSMTHLAHLGFLGGADGAGSSGTDAGSLALRDLSSMPFHSRAAHTCTNGEGAEAQPPHKQLPLGFLCGGCAQGTSSGDVGTAAESPHASPCAGEGATAQMPTLLWGGPPASCGHQADARPRKKLKAVWVVGVDLQAVESAVTFCKQTEEDERVAADGSTSACGEGPLNGGDGRRAGRALALEVHLQLPDVASMQQVSLNASSSGMRSSAFMEAVSASAACPARDDKDKVVITCCGKRTKKYPVEHVASKFFFYPQRCQHEKDGVWRTGIRCPFAGTGGGATCKRKFRVCTVCPDFKVRTSPWKVFDDQEQKEHEGTVWHQFYARTDAILSMRALEPTHNIAAIQKEVEDLQLKLKGKIDSARNYADIEPDIHGRMNAVHQHLGQLLKEAGGQGPRPQNSGGSGAEDPRARREEARAATGADAGADTGGSAGGMDEGLEGLPLLQGEGAGPREGDVPQPSSCDPQVHALPNAGVHSLLHSFAYNSAFGHPLTLVP